MKKWYPTILGLLFGIAFALLFIPAPANSAPLDAKINEYISATERALQSREETRADFADEDEEIENMDFVNNLIPYCGPAYVEAAQKQETLTYYFRQRIKDGNKARLAALVCTAYFTGRLSK